MPGVMPPPVMRPFPAPTPPIADRERYQALESNPLRLVAEAPVSTFSIDVDTGSYSNVRRMLVAGRLPPKDAVRIEEMINYFPYAYAGPRKGEPFAVHAEMVDSPWREGARLLRIGIKGEDRARESLPPSNLVFLVDVSGSMRSADKLPLLKSSLKLLAQRLRPQDRISIVTYASGTNLVLSATAGDDRLAIVNAIDALQAGGSTAGASGIELAYRTALQAHIPGGINRILLATDGDFNVGVTDFGQLKAMVEEKRKSGIALSTLGFGGGNYNEHLMEQLADAGDGAYSYIDSLMEAHKVLVNEASSTLETIARDVKIQVEFNPARVVEYRLIGYENRMLA
ncbi:MAG: von Willebrand factor type A domain-containing protein, partial [Gemmatimonadales bacterium]|nr:von Willebrand factor type A domain-containing protein [Gemmatimonadales bacterium]